jgi:hypothetical protein
MGQVFMRPKKAGAFTVQSNRLIYQSRGVSDQIVRHELENRLKLTLEEGYIKGLGTEKQPKGILNQSINAMTAVSSNGGRFRLDNAASMIQYLDVLNEYKDGGMNFGWLMRPEVRGGMKRERVINYSGQSESSAQPVLPMNLLMSNKVLEDQLGHKIRTTTLLSATEIQGTSSTCSTVLFGNWKKFRIGMWRDFVLRASDVAGDGSTGSALLDDTMYIVCFQETDCMVDRDAAFCKMAGAQTAEASW